MFRGRSVHTLDEKGRLSIPVRFRDVLKTKYDSRLIVTNLPSCLAAYPFDEWRELEESFGNFKLAPPEVVSFQRYFLAGGIECNMDSHGRILLPANLREDAEIGKEVVLLGMLKYFEIWSKERLDNELRRAKENFDQYSRLISTIETAKA
ncbi:MAG: division/cell wall cluster transcriptional repressor MraZ [Dissulfurimicrobium sp.]|uniref:division/cell wall cluster transcriptional repressor MraZ n=1 Tax=Dissulfurimicrobium sp. TaxID=2022436 RepID=UPI00404AB214